MDRRQGRAKRMRARCAGGRPNAEAKAIHRRYVAGPFPRLVPIAAVLEVPGRVSGKTIHVPLVIVPYRARWVDDARTARAALDELREERHHAALQSVCIADMRGWLGRLMATPEFVRPEGWTGDPRRYHAQRVTRSATPATGLVIVPRLDGFAIAQPLYCATAEHADRIEDAALRNQQGLFQTVQEITARFRPHAFAPAPAARAAPAAVDQASPLRAAEGAN